jgi:hypothetical protein
MYEAFYSELKKISGVKETLLKHPGKSLLFAWLASEGLKGPIGRKMQSIGAWTHEKGRRLEGRR